MVNDYDTYKGFNPPRDFQICNIKKISIGKAKSYENLDGCYLIVGSSKGVDSYEKAIFSGYVMNILNERECVTNYVCNSWEDHLPYNIPTAFTSSLNVFRTVEGYSNIDRPKARYNGNLCPLRVLTTKYSILDFITRNLDTKPREPKKCKAWYTQALMTVRNIIKSNLLNDVYMTSITGDIVTIKYRPHLTRHVVDFQYVGLDFELPLNEHVTSLIDDMRSVFKFIIFEDDGDDPYA